MELPQREQVLGDCLLGGEGLGDKMLVFDLWRSSSGPMPAPLATHARLFPERIENACEQEHAVHAWFDCMHAICPIVEIYVRLCAKHNCSQ